MTFREIRTLKYGDLLIGPQKRVFQFLKFCNFVRGKATYLDVRALPNYGAESWAVTHFTNDSWAVTTPEQVETIQLLYNPVDDNF